MIQTDYRYVICWNHHGNGKCRCCPWMLSILQQLWFEISGILQDLSVVQIQSKPILFCTSFEPIREIHVGTFCEHQQIRGKATFCTLSPTCQSGPSLKWDSKYSSCIPFHFCFQPLSCSLLYVLTVRDKMIQPIVVVYYSDNRDQLRHQETLERF